MSYVCQYGRGKRVNIGQVGVITPAQARDKAKQILSQAIMGVLPKNDCKTNEKLTLENLSQVNMDPGERLTEKTAKMICED